MKKYFVLLAVIVALALASAASTTGFDAVAISCNAVATTGACATYNVSAPDFVHIPSVQSFTWQTIFAGGTATSISVTLEGSVDGTTWTTLDTSTSTSGETRTKSTAAVLFFRCNVGTYSTNGTTLTCQIMPTRATGGGAGDNLGTAIASDIVALFSTCSGTEYLGADGACHTGSGAGEFSALTGGSNTAAAMVVGSGASLAPSGTGKLTDGGPVFYAEWYGVTGTNDQTPINAALTAACSAGGGTVQLLAKTYNIVSATAPITIPCSYVNLNGVAMGFSSTGSAGGSVIKDTSATGDMIQVVGTGANCASGALIGNTVRNLELFRTVAPTAGYGINLTDSCWPIVENVNGYDAGTSSEYHSGTANSYIQHVQWYYALASGSTRNGVELDGSTANNSTDLENVEVANGVGSGLHVRGLYMHGSLINDLWTHNFQTSLVDYGVYVDGSGASTRIAADDVHFQESILDGSRVSAYYITGLTTSAGGLVEINGGWADSISTATSPNIDIESSSGVNVQGVEIRDGATTPQGAVKIASSTGISIRGLSIVYNTSSAANVIDLEGSSDNIIAENNVYTASGSAASDIYLGTTSTRNVISGNSLYGYQTTGIVVNDSGSINNILYPNNIDTTHMAAYTDAGVNNNWGVAPFGTGSSFSFLPPSGIYVCTTTCTVTPPVPKAGYQFCAFNGDNVSTVITLAALGSSAFYENTARTGYGTVGTGTFTSGGAAKDFVCIVGLDATHYITTSFNGTWTAH